MTVRLGLLAILNQGSCYGYQLRTELDRRTGSTGPINVGQIYNTLDRLERDKLVRKLTSNYYEITDAGRGEVNRWFDSSSPAGTSIAELASKIALAASLPGVDVARVIERQRALAERETDLATRVDRPTSGEDLARAGELGLGVMQLATEVPKRGRPVKTSA